jgi:hypothetical protein
LLQCVEGRVGQLRQAARFVFRQRASRTRDRRTGCDWRSIHLRRLEWTGRLNRCRFTPLGQSGRERIASCGCRCTRPELIVWNRRSRIGGATPLVRIIHFWFHAGSDSSIQTSPSALPSSSPFRHFWSQ